MRRPQIEAELINELLRLDATYCERFYIERPDVAITKEEVDDVYHGTLWHKIIMDRIEEIKEIGV